MENGCFMPKDSQFRFDNSWDERGTRHACGRHSFYNHYETEEELPPGDYNLRVAIDFGGTRRRAEVPVTVHTPVKRLAVSGIALSNRYFAHIDIQRIVSSDQAGVLAQPTVPAETLQYYGLQKDVQHVLPFTLTPLVSKGIEFTPTGDTLFKKKDPLVAYFEVYEPLLTSGGNVHVQFEICIIDAKTGEVKSNTGFRPADGYVNPAKAVIPISQHIEIGELAPGEYQVQVRAKDSSGVTTDWRTTSFTRE
jgi:hypothetical protein